MHKRNFVAVSICFLLVACGAAVPVHVKLHYRPVVGQRTATNSESDSRNVHISRIDILDKRITKDNLGSMGAGIYGDGVTEWVHEGILSLSKLGYTFSSLVDKTSQIGWLLKVDIIRTSCRAILMHTRCTVLIDVGYFSNGALIQKKSYYGTHLEQKEMFMRFGEKAILQSLNSALEQSIVKLEADLRKIENQSN